MFVKAGAVLDSTQALSSADRRLAGHVRQHHRQCFFLVLPPGREGGKGRAQAGAFRADVREAGGAVGAAHFPGGKHGHNGGTPSRTDHIPPILERRTAAFKLLCLGHIVGRMGGILMYP